MAIATIYLLVTIIEQVILHQHLLIKVTVCLVIIIATIAVHLVLRFTKQSIMVTNLVLQAKQALYQVIAMEVVIVTEDLVQVASLKSLYCTLFILLLSF